MEGLDTMVVLSPGRDISKWWLKILKKTYLKIKSICKQQKCDT